MLELLVAVFTCLTVYYLYTRQKPRNYPPGLPNLPLLGSIPFLERDMRKNITKLHKKFGPIFSFNLGSENWVVICDYALLKEAFSKDEFNNRPSIGAFGDFVFADEHEQVRGLMFSNGSEWQEQRRFSLRHLRDFGFGKSSMEHLIHEEIVKCLKMIKSDIASKPDNRVSLVLRLNVAILNALWHITTGEKLEYDDPKLKEIINRINDVMMANQLGGLIFIIPWLKYVIPDQIGYTKAKKMFDEVYKLIEKSYLEHKATLDPEHPRDFLDVFIKQMNEAEQDPTSSFHGTKGIQNMYVGFINLFVGGSETTSNTLNWTLFHLSQNLDLQRKAAEEILTVVGKDRLPSLEDRKNTPLVEAIVTEVHRISALAFMGIPRATSGDITVGGYFLPKGTRIMTGIYEVMHDEKYWGDPEVFRPERFLDPKTGKFKNSDRVVPFGLGKRICIGSTLAQNELYLFLAAFLQHFEFSDPNPDSLEPLVGFLLGCPDFTMRIQERA